MSMIPNHFPEVIDPGPTDAELAAIEAHAPRRLRVVPAPVPDKMAVPVEALAAYESAVDQLRGFLAAVAEDLARAADLDRAHGLADLLRGRLAAVGADVTAWHRAKWTA